MPFADNWSFDILCGSSSSSNSLHLNRYSAVFLIHLHSCFAVSLESTLFSHWGFVVRMVMTHGHNLYITHTKSKKRLK